MSFITEGGITSLQAYQVLRNCGTELVYEKPEDRVKLAHDFWDQLMEIGEFSITEQNKTWTFFPRVPLFNHHSTLHATSIR